MLPSRLPRRFSPLKLSPESWTSTSHYIPNRSHNSGSAKLFADAEREESAEPPKKSSRLTVLEQQHENWTGEESIQDAALRMLVDKYKPLRTGTIQTAEQKLKQAPPKVDMPPLAFDSDSRTSSGTISSTPSSGSWATEVLIQPKEGHKPWHTEFKAPSHTSASIRSARTPPSPVGRLKVSLDDERLRKTQKDEAKRTAQGTRLTQARESTLDYRLGISKQPGGGIRRGRLNPVSMKGWSGLIEEKIERARLAGLFNTVKGRGEPLVRTVDEGNPFIAREEFLMNRIVQRNGAAPPWVELQGELDTAVSNFRSILRQSWTRRAVRNLTLAASPTPPSLYEIRRLRDAEWERKERSYHETGLEEVNSLVRKYNGLAPYAVRRPYYILSVELEKLYEDSVDDIAREISRLASSAYTSKQGPNHDGEESYDLQGSLEGDAAAPRSTRFLDFIRGWMDRMSKAIRARS